MVGLEYRWVPSLQARSDVASGRHRSLFLVKVWNGNRCSRYTGDAIAANGAASLTLGAAPSEVYPCPPESILSGLRGLSMRSNRPQLSKYGVDSVPVTSVRCFQHEVSLKTLVVYVCGEHISFLISRVLQSCVCGEHELVHLQSVSNMRLWERYTGEMSRAYARSEFTDLIRRSFSHALVVLHELSLFWSISRCACGEHTSSRVSRVFRACACNEFTSVSHLENGLCMRLF